MWWGIDPRWTRAWKIAKAVGLFIVVALVVGASVVLMRSCEPQADDGVDIAIDHDAARIDAELAAAKKRADDLEKALGILEADVEIIRGEIADSVRQREELHDALDEARSIDDIDRILRRGIGR
jgi:septal ring factor EnvC (AmiA/AmiB activator)